MSHGQKTLPLHHALLLNLPAKQNKRTEKNRETKEKSHSRLTTLLIQLLQTHPSFWPVSVGDRSKLSPESPAETLTVFRELGHPSLTELPFRR